MPCPHNCLALTLLPVIIKKLIIIIGWGKFFEPGKLFLGGCPPEPPLGAESPPDPPREFFKPGKFFEPGL